MCPQDPISLQSLLSPPHHPHPALLPHEQQRLTNLAAGACDSEGTHQHTCASPPSDAAAASVAVQKAAPEPAVNEPPSSGGAHCTAKETAARCPGQQIKGCNTMPCTAPACAFFPLCNPSRCCPDCSCPMHGASCLSPCRICATICPDWLLLCCRGEL